MIRETEVWNIEVIQSMKFQKKFCIKNFFYSSFDFSFVVLS